MWNALNQMIHITKAMNQMYQLFSGFSYKNGSKGYQKKKYFEW